LVSLGTHWEILVAQFTGLRRNRATTERTANEQSNSYWNFRRGGLHCSLTVVRTRTAHRLDGGSWLYKQLTGPPKVIAEFFGPVSTSPFDEYFIGATDTTNNTAELTAVCQALYFLINDGGHWPAVIVADSEIALSAMDGMRALFEGVPEVLTVTEAGGVNVVLKLTGGGCSVPRY
jgi:hypothetical protein